MRWDDHLGLPSLHVREHCSDATGPLQLAGIEIVGYDRPGINAAPEQYLVIILRLDALILGDLRDGARERDAHIVPSIRALLQYILQRGLEGAAGGVPVRHGPLLFLPAS